MTLLTNYLNFANFYVSKSYTEKRRELATQTRNFQGKVSKGMVNKRNQIIQFTTLFSHSNNVSA